MYERGKVKKVLGNKIGLQVILEQCGLGVASMGMVFVGMTCLGMACLVMACLDMAFSGVILMCLACNNKISIIAYLLANLEQG